MEAGIPFTTCGTLTAIEKTPLHARLEREGRLLPFDSAERRGQGAADINFVPARMTVEELQRGYNWLVRALYKPENYARRLGQALRPFTRSSRRSPQRRSSTGACWALLLLSPSSRQHFSECSLLSRPPGPISREAWLV